MVMQRDDDQHHCHTRLLVFGYNIVYTFLLFLPSSSFQLAIVEKKNWPTLSLSF